MPTYAELAQELESKGIGRGVQESSQGRLSLTTGVPLGQGVCAGLVQGWLTARKTGTNFWAMSEQKPTTSLLGEFKALDTASGVQGSGGWVEGYKLLAKVGLALASETPYPCGICGLANTVAKSALEDAQSYYVLSLWGEVAGHETAFHRPWQFIGKSSTAQFYDPNYGEFTVTKEGAAHLLLTIGKGYPNLAKVCMVRKFNG